MDKNYGKATTKEESVREDASGTQAAHQKAAAATTERPYAARYE
jgi:hypothetical protein